MRYEAQQLVAAGLTHANLLVPPIPEPASENEILLHVTGAVTVEQVREWCTVRLSASKRPRAIELVENGVGEVRRL